MSIKDFFTRPSIPAGVFIGFTTILGGLSLVQGLRNDVSRMNLLQKAATEITTAQKHVNDVLIKGIELPEDTESLYRPVYTFGEKTMHILYSDGTVGDALPQSMAKCGPAEAGCDGLNMTFHKVSEALSKARQEIDNSKGIGGLIIVPAPQDRPMAIPPSSTPTSGNTAPAATL